MKPSRNRCILASLVCISVGACTEADGPAAYLANLPAAARSTVEAPDAACGISGTVPVVTGLSAEKLDRFHSSIGFDLAAIRRRDAAVPPVVMADLPDDIRSIDSVERRKALFVRAVLPIILFVNQRIAEQRSFVAAMRDRTAQGNALSADQRARLAGLAACYGTEEGDIGALMARVDIVPPALGIAQAAIESGWGTSRFLRQGNALMGQHTRTDSRMVPADLENPDFGIRRFDHVLDSVMAYARNLNTHPAYRRFRAERAAMRRQGSSPDSDRLSATLVGYSERGGSYVKALRDIIRTNDLAPFDRARIMEKTDAPEPSKRHESVPSI